MNAHASGPPRKKLAPAALRNANRGGTSGGTTGNANDTPASRHSQRRPYLVVVDADVPRIWRECDTLAEAVAACAYLRPMVPARILVLRGRS